MLKTLREIQSYFHECAQAAHRQAVKVQKLRYPDCYDGYEEVALTSEEKAFEHAAGFINEYIKQHEADLLKG